ncbi:hypothetical protein BFP70_11445 [Thioclava sp. SK-1]|uniref:hypothetical protein n=1 Tax=Thioclava sp. SK-1 TaxID=1889770 RepID=UPI0008254589|nr:hypothetical protein [Thioclava sp. SK-1]OCX64624.1 hypothetical protein BFP70_11445 [Thioclava sp. SK-1]
MNFSSLDVFLDTGQTLLAKGPIALIFIEDLVEVDSTLTHHLGLGFAAVIALAPPELTLPADIAQKVHRIDYPLRHPDAMVSAMNQIIAACPPQTWLYYCYNGEYLFYPFSETRNIREVLAFHTEERRSAMLTYVVDLYAADLQVNPNGVNLQEAMIDRAGYYALARPDPANDNHPKERQLDFFGGLRWRFEEHVPEKKRKIDRISLFRTQPGLQFHANHTFSDEEYNTYACPWHHNLTAAVASFRAAKALKANAGSTFDVQSFYWYNSTPFEWNSAQLMNLGLMEPGQWF